MKMFYKNNRIKKENNRWIKDIENKEKIIKELEALDETINKKIKEII